MKVLITGGCGFIGANIAKRRLEEGAEVIIVDDLSRKGSRENLQRLKNIHGKLKFYQKDINSGAFQTLFQKHSPFNIVYHMAAQVAVTSSVKDPWDDFERNAVGTLSVLEEIVKSQSNPFFIYASTNKVYGELEDVPVQESTTRYEYRDRKGIDESRGVDFHSPYGCSKGCADQYVRDYARIYDLNTVVFRQSCIYGDMQTGIEDQGWLSWFCQKVMLNDTIRLYGNGKQVRDILYVDDLIDLYDLAYRNQKKVKGQIYNVGGGPLNTVSLLELIDELKQITGKKVYIERHPPRAGDQKVYISDIRKIQEIGWEPTVNPKDGIRRLYEWTLNNI